MNTYKGYKRAYYIDSDGSFETVMFDFEADTEAHGSCLLRWQNKYYIFGSDNAYKSFNGLRHQVSIVNGNKLERKGTLAFPFGSGTCTVLNQQTIVLCFHWDDPKACRQSKNPLGSFTKLPDSKYEHRSTRIASFDGKKNHFKLIITKLQIHSSLLQTGKIINSLKFLLCRILNGKKRNPILLLHVLVTFVLV